MSIEEQKLKLKLLINDLPIDSETESRVWRGIEELIKQARIEEGKKSYTRGYNAGYAGAKRGGGKRGDDALKNWIISIIDERLNQLTAQSQSTKQER